jgi:LEA14-like dessication related protein
MRPKQNQVQPSPVMFPLTVVVLLVGCLAVWGCGARQLARGELEAPEVRLQALRLQPPNQQGWPLTCILNVRNPNSMTIRVLGYDYQVWVEGQSMARGAGDRAVILPAQGEAQVEVPVVLKLKNLPGLLPKILQEEKVTVEIAGGLRLPQTLGLRVPFRFREEVTPREGLEHLQPFLSR